MTLHQKQFIRALIELCIDEGFGTSYPFAPIAEKLGITEPLYDPNTETGILWEFGPFGGGMNAGMIHINRDGKAGSVAYEEHQRLADWCRVQAPPVG